MNQQKIGVFIAECRKQKNLTQLELSEKLGVTDRSVSNWENGKCMPDVSLYKSLCEELEITINELLCGERLSQERYQEKSEENILKTVTKVTKLEKKKKSLLILLSITLILIVSYVVYCNILLIESTLEYDDRVMKCYFEDSQLIYEVQGLTTVNIYHTEVQLDNEKIIFIHSKLPLKHKRYSHWETWESMAELLNGENSKFKSGQWFDIDSRDIIKVYYTKQSLEKINKSDKDKLKQIIKESNLMCENK